VQVKLEQLPMVLVDLIEEENPRSPLGGTNIDMDPQDTIEGQQHSRQESMRKLKTSMKYSTLNKKWRDPTT
jgi:hypothetical protein